ncbi:MAG TPA: hypothetical protein QGG18_10235 [Rhodospirillales bacterium]|nr:hypothetical protein [Rhodospirillales bacterium]
MDTNPTLRFCRIWLTSVEGVFALFGIVMAVASDTTAFRALFGPLIDSAFWETEIHLTCVVTCFENSGPV